MSECAVTEAHRLEVAGCVHHWADTRQRGRRLAPVGLQGRSAEDQTALFRCRRCGAERWLDNELAPGLKGRAPGRPREPVPERPNDMELALGGWR